MLGLFGAAARLLGAAARRRRRRQRAAEADRGCGASRYLTHNFALNLVEKTPLGNDGILWSVGDVLVAFPLAVPIAWVIHVTFEKPLVRVGHKLARRDKPFHAV